MTPKIIELKQAPVVLVELPKGAYYENLCFLPPAPGINYFLYENGVNTPYKEIVPGIDKIWTKLGYLSDLTEDQFAECVDKYPSNAKPARYVNYTYKKPNGGMQVSRVI